MQSWHTPTITDLGNLADALGGVGTVTDGTLLEGLGSL